MWLINTDANYFLDSDYDGFGFSLKSYQGQYTIGQYIKERKKNIENI